MLIVNSMYANVKFCSFLFSIFFIAGCAHQYGEIHEKLIKVAFFSNSNPLNYYSLTLTENEQLGGGFSDLDKESYFKKLEEITAPRYTNNNHRNVKSGEYVIVIECGDFYTRQLVYFDEKTRYELSCSR